LKIWVDLENSPHVLFFEPVVGELRRRGHEVVVTARRFCNTLPLAHARGTAVHAIGRGYDRGRSHAIKRCHHVVRSLQLWRFARARRFDVAASHASRTQASAAALLGIPAWTAVDYEHADLHHLGGVRCFMIPGVMPADAFDRAGIPRAVIRRYDGLKEDVYLSGFRPVIDVRRMLRVADDEALVVFRPCSDNAHYGSNGNRALERQVLQRLIPQERVRIIALPRTARQARRLRAFENGNGKLRVHAVALDGPSAVHAADLVVSGGGTMAREAAVLGVPAISHFTGPLGAVDEFLAGQERIRLIRTRADLDRVGAVVRRPPAQPRANGGPLREVVDAICATAGAGPS
jgi:hypothetical protein